MLFQLIRITLSAMLLIVLLPNNGLLATPQDGSVSETLASRIPAAPGGRHEVAKSHPRLLGSRERLQQLAREREPAYRRVVSVARNQDADLHAKMISLALVCAIEQDRALGRQAISLAMETIRGPIRKGHVTFGHDLARCALVYDLCHEYWSPEERTEFHRYMNQTVDANVRSETHVFHNAWYGYKQWGIGLACYATLYENPRAVNILRDLESDYATRAAPLLNWRVPVAGGRKGITSTTGCTSGSSYCEAARWCEGVDYYALAPRFYGQRAVASMFETYPGISIYGSRRSIPIGDGGGRVFGGDRDKTLAARRILVDFFQDDPVHRFVHDYNERTPRSSVGVYAYKDFLWHNPALPRTKVDQFRLSHISSGPGFVYARSSWQDDATYFFFKCGNRFTAHQHLDVGNFLIFKYEELVGDGGHYDGFGTSHDVNYHLRSIAHNTILVHDESEVWPGIRAGKVTGNDGGQAHNWPHHNGAVADPAAWHKDADIYKIGAITAFEDRGDYLYVAGDCSKAYSAQKLEQWVRQIVFLRPGTFVIFDRVVTRDPSFRENLAAAGHEATGETGFTSGRDQRQRAVIRAATAATADEHRTAFGRRALSLRWPALPASARYWPSTGMSYRGCSHPVAQDGFLPARADGDEYGSRCRAGRCGRGNARECPSAGRGRHNCICERCSRRLDLAQWTHATVC